MDNNSIPIPEADAGTAPDGAPTHLYLLLDRSGSMASIRNEAVAGVNAFVTGQQIDGADARLTLVQFDSHDLSEVVIDDAPIREVTSLRPHQLQPRGATPLLDATAQLIALATARTDARAAGGHPERVVVITVTDGLENASREFNRDQVRDLVAAREAAGWVFIFLSAGIDAYTEARSIGYADGSVQAWSADREGADLAFGSVGHAVREVRGKRRRGEQVDARDVFEGLKPAEADRRRKRGDLR